MRIQHNILSMNAYRNYGNNTSALGKNLEKLSSGYKINRAGDDAAGLAISEKMRAQIKGLDAAQKNVKDGISLVKTAEGAMQEVQDMLSRMKYLATQSANGTYDDGVDRKNLQMEVDQLKEEIDRIGQNANFNGIYILKGDYDGGKVTLGGTNNGGGEEAVVIDGVDTVKGTANFTDGGAAAPKWEVDFTGIGFDKDGKVNVTLGGETYEIDVTADMDAAGFATALKDAIDNGTGYTDGTGGAYTATVTGTTLKLEGANNAAATNATLFDDFDIAAVDPANTPAGQADDAAGDYTVTITAAGGKDMATDSLPAGNITIDGKQYEVGSGKTIDSDTVDNANDQIAAAVTEYNKETDTNYTAAFDAATGKITFTKKDTAPDDAAAPGAVSFADETVASAGDVTKVEDNSNNNTDNGKGLTLQIGDSSAETLKLSIGTISQTALGITAVNIGTPAGASAAIQTVKDAINYVSSVRGLLGAYQNRLEHTQNNLSVMHENIQDAESTIRDTDVADEMMAYTKNNILVQSAQAMLAQANAVPQGVLQLLQ